MAPTATGLASAMLQVSHPSWRPGQPTRLRGPSRPPELEASRELAHSPRALALELVQALAPALPAPLAELVRRLVAEDRLVEALHRAEAALSALRHRPGLSALPAEAPLCRERALECERCPELRLCGGARSGCSWASCSSRCGGCGVRCPSRADLPSWRQATGRLDLEDLVTALGEPPALPALVPVLDLEELRDWGVARFWPGWALSLSEAHSRRSGAPWRSWAAGQAAAEARRAGAARLVLTGVAADGFDLVLAPAWSVYDDDPRLEHLFAIRQSLQVAVALARQQPVAPTLHWYRRWDLERQLHWARACQARAVAIDCSTLPARQRWLEVRAAMAYMRAALPGVELHVQGPATRERLGDLARLGGIVVYSQRPAALARARRLLDAELRDQVGPDDPAECLLISVEHLARHLAGRA